MIQEFPGVQTGLNLLTKDQFRTEPIPNFILDLMGLKIECRSNKIMDQI